MFRRVVNHSPFQPSFVMISVSDDNSFFGCDGFKHIKFDPVRFRFICRLNIVSGIFDFNFFLLFREVYAYQ